MSKQISFSRGIVVLSILLFSASSLTILRKVEKHSQENEDDGLICNNHVVLRFS
ncbi:MAG TPA: hypothetical protein PK191_06725 [Niabella sp.]|nr:hypothetical protein [Niabella sp.]HOZ95711.1 hypothetical protein [Niabella sp.]HQW15954.1 hypothetical protein [Niabella sp.]HQX21193.1 hypothetical protein [Niabella sp.]HQX40716.1 hypothetical protein [Niabella sp.]